jgi:hypothetical protein
VTEETKRIIEASNCPYLEDLLTCVHITQLKILTSIRVSQKQKKIDLDIPKLNVFVHKCYISFARKLYSNVYLFENDIAALQHQKNMRECEILCRESIFEAIRDSMPIEQILRSYIDETTDEEIIEEISKVETDEQLTETPQIEEEEKKEEDSTKDNEEVVKKPAMTISKNENKESNENDTEAENTEESVTNSEEKSDESAKETPVEEKPNIKLNITDKVLSSVKEEVENKPPTPKASVDFKDNDAVINYQTSKSPLTIKTEVVESVSAPKTPDRLEKISYERNEQRKLEEAEEDDSDEEEEEDRIKIHDSANITLDTLDVHSLDKGLKISTPILTDIEVLS